MEKNPLFSGRLLLMAALAVYLPLVVWGQAVGEYPLRPVTPKEVLPVERVLYRSGSFDERGLNRVIEDVAVPTVTVYRASSPAHRRAAVVICPGGGYRMVVIDREGHMIARYLQRQGITAVVLKYRLPNPAEWTDGLPRPQRDALDAIRYVRAHAGEWGIDPQRVGIIGSSAGGHLAGSTAIFGAAADDSRPDFVALLYPVITMSGEVMHSGSREKLLGPAPSDELMKRYSLEQQVKAGLPPFFLVHATNDNVVPVQNSQLMADALRQVGVSVELLTPATGGHGFSLGRDEESSRWKEVFLNWLDQLP